MADGFGLREQLDARIATTRRSLVYPAVLTAAGPAALWTAAFVVFWLSGLSDGLPAEAQAAIGLLFYLGLALCLWAGFHLWRPPNDQDARDLIDQGIEGRPLSVWTDHPARADHITWRLWEAHRDRMAALVAGSGKVSVAARWKKADPFHLRLIVPVAVIAVAVFAGPHLPDRLFRGLAPDVGALFGANRLKVEAWLTPPAYTGDAPFVMTAGQTANVAQGSEVTLRVISPGRPSVRVIPVSGRAVTLRPGPGIDGAFESKIKIDKAMRLSVRFWGERASFPFTVKPDKPPTVEFVSPPKLGQGDHTEFQWKVGDDYGVTRLELVARMAHPPKGAEKLEEVVPVQTVSLDPKDETGSYSQDLVRHRWAGLDVMVKLRATDAGGNTAESKEVAYTLPAKIFLQPIARSAQEIRATLLREWRPYSPPDKDDRFSRQHGTGLDAFADVEASRMRHAPEGVKMAALMIDALTYKPEGYFEDPVLFMGLRAARAIIESARDKAEAEESANLLWDVALRAEYGSLADAKAALDAARRALEEALRNGASEEDIKRLLDMYKQAVENYLAAQMADALKNGRVTQGDGQQQAQGGGRALGDDELQRMLDALTDLSETGAREQARQLLNDMSKMLDKMQNMQLQLGKGGSGQQQDGPMSRALNKALQQTNRSLNDQRDLNDQTEQAQKQGSSPKRNQELADQQRALRERLEQQQRSGGGQPRPDEPGQGQQGRQQGQAQQGQGQQGQQPGQGQLGQRGQQGQPGQQGQQGQRPGQQAGPGQQQGPNGQRNAPGDSAGGPPGVQADGRLGQENGESRRLLARSLDAMKRAEDALRRGDFDAARKAQQEAMGALQDRSAELSRLADNSDPDAKADKDKRDILGRLSDGQSGYGDNVKVPDEMERQRARDILNELRRRAGNRLSPAEEQEYLRRLLERF